MLQNLHVKNLALITETEVEFKEGLNILTGETGHHHWFGRTGTRREGSKGTAPG